MWTISVHHVSRWFSHRTSLCPPKFVSASIPLPPRLSASSKMLQNLRDKRKKLKAAIKGVVSRPSSPIPSGSGAQQEVGLALHTPLTSRSPSQNLSSPATVQAHNISPGPTEPASVSVQSQSSVDVPAIVIDPPQAISVAADVVSPDS